MIKKLAKTEGSLSQHAEMRRKNERAVLSLLRQEDGLPSSVVAKKTGLAPQTVSVLLRTLEDRGLVFRGKTEKGKRGQPAVPLHLNCTGHYSLGISLGWQFAKFVLINLAGEVLGQSQITYEFPDVTDIAARVVEQVEELIDSCDIPNRQNILGVGIARPVFSAFCDEAFTGPASDYDYLNGQEFLDEIQRKLNLPLADIQKGQAGCIAEAAYGRIRRDASMGYAFVSTFVDGGVHLHSTTTRTFDVHTARLGETVVCQSDGSFMPLRQIASLMALARFLNAGGFPVSAGEAHLWDWDAMVSPVEEWVAAASGSLAVVIYNSCVVLGLEAVVIDGVMPRSVKSKLVAAIKRKIGELNVEGVVDCTMLTGDVGPNAPAIGAAHTVLNAHIFATYN